MRKGIVFAGIVSVASLIACVNKTTGTQDYYASMERVEDLVIPIDSVTIQQPGYIQLVDDSTLYFYNTASHNICIANLNTKEIEKIQLHGQGPNAVGFVNAFYCSDDSLYIYESWGKRITVMNKEGEVSSRFSVPDLNKSGSPFQYAVSSFPTSLSPYIVNDGKHILNGMSGIKIGDEKFGTTLLYDTNTDSVITSNPYLEIYGPEGNWKNGMYSDIVLFHTL